jgi:serine/threonine protein kinase
MADSAGTELLKPGETILNAECTIEEHLGSGGQGQVYLARHSIFGQVAVKRLHRHIAAQAEGLERFRRELRITHQLPRKHLILVHNFDKDLARDEWFSVMEYANSESLKDKLTAEAPLPVVEAIDLTITLCQALAHVHEYPYVHGDLRPSNVLFHTGLIGKWTLKLSDFGSAFQPVRAGVLPLPSGLKEARTMLYVSPELLDASDPKNTEALTVDVDQRADIYAMGVILYEMLTGRPPFWELSDETKGIRVREDRKRALLQKIKHQVPPEPRKQRREILPSLNALVMKALAKDPANRFTSVSEMQARLEEILQREKVRLAELDRLRPLAERALREKQWKQASDLLYRILDQAPDDPDALQKLRIAQDQQRLVSLRDQIPQKMDDGLWQEAKDVIGEALTIAPDDVTLTTWEEDIDDQLAIIEILEQTEKAKRKTDWPRVIALCREALDLDPDHAETSSLLKQAETQYRIVRLRYRADTLLERGNQKAALKRLKRLSVLDPANEELKDEIRELQKTVDLETYYTQGKRAYDEQRWKDAVRALKKVLAIDPFYHNGEAAGLKLDAEKRVKETRGKLPQEILQRVRQLFVIFDPIFKWLREHQRAVFGAILSGLLSLIILLLTVDSETPLGMMREKVITYFSGTPTPIPRSIGETEFAVNGATVVDITQPHSVTDTRQIRIEVRVRDTDGEPISDDEVSCDWTFDPPLPKQAIEEEGGCQISYQVPESLDSPLVEVEVRGKDKIAGTSTNIINIILQSDEGDSNE